MLAPLTPAVGVGTWTFSLESTPLIVAAAAGYLWCYRRNPQVGPGPLAVYLTGLLVWALATMSFIGVYAQALFWVRALQILLLLFMAPLLLALGQPLTVLRGAVPAAARDRIDDVLNSAPARFVVHPLTTSLAMLVTPWLLYLTSWYRVSLESSAVGAITRILLLAIGFGYFYARLQADPVPRRYSQMLSLVISIVESLGDGVLGLVLWQGSLICADFYATAHPGWGPSLRDDQTIGAGILWIVGDVLALPFLILLVRALSVDESSRVAQVDAELDRIDELARERRQVASAPQSGSDVASSSLWWENDPQLRERFGRG